MNRKENDLSDRDIAASADCEGDDRFENGGDMPPLVLHGISQEEANAAGTEIGKFWDGVAQHSTATDVTRTKNHGIGIRSPGDGGLSLEEEPLEVSGGGAPYEEEVVELELAKPEVESESFAARRAREDKDLPVPAPFNPVGCLFVLAGLVAFLWQGYRFFFATSFNLYWTLAALITILIGLGLAFYAGSQPQPPSRQ